MESKKSFGFMKTKKSDVQEKKEHVEEKSVKSFESTLDDDESVPITECGQSMLGGMGHEPDKEHLSGPRTRGRRLLPARGKAAARGRGQRGGTARIRGTLETRPSTSNLFTGMLDEVPERARLEVPLHPKRRRVFCDKTTTAPLSTSVWYQSQPSISGENIQPTQAQSELAEPGPSTSFELQYEVESVSLASVDAGIYEVHVPSPDNSVELPAACTPPAPRKLAWRLKLKPQKLHEFENVSNRGSEDEWSDDDDDVPFVSARRAREILGDGDEDQLASEEFVFAEPDFAWPPVICTTSPPPPSLSPPSSAAAPTPPPVYSPVYGPSDKFDFEWKGFQEPQVLSELRRELFCDMLCGPTTNEPYPDPYGAFVAIWDTQIMEHIVVETNRYAQEVVVNMLESSVLQPNSRMSRWRDTTVDEMYVYFAMILAMGIVVKSRLEEYWNKQQDIFCTPQFSFTMSFNRFNLLSKCLHFQNNMSLDPLLSNSQAKVSKLKPVIDHLNIKFSSLFNMGRNIALDESLMQWKGCLSINQFLGNKAAKLGIKTYEVCDSTTGYLWRFEVYAGLDSLAPQETTPLSGSTPSIVLRVLRSLEGKGHTIWMDNFYNSPALARELKSIGFDCVGTLRTNRQFVPTELAKLGKSDMMEGQISGCTSGDVDLLVWRDNNLVGLISTYHGLATAMCDDVKKPSIVADYNVCMGGVDKKDQLLSAYPIERRRTRIWYKKLFRRLLNVSVLNSYILYKHFHNTTHRTFRQDLVRQILTRHLSQHPPAQRIPQTPYHFPALYGQATNQSQNRRIRRQCVVCSKASTVYCEGCDVTLCISKCFKQHHLNQRL